MSGYGNLDGNKIYGMISQEGLDHDPFAKVRAILTELQPLMPMLDPADQEFLVGVESSVSMDVPIDRSTAMRLIEVLQKGRNLAHLAQR